MVELGVQTFDDAVLATAGRGCAARDVEDASRAVCDAGLGLGLQLLPGLPGHTPGMLAGDVRRCIEIAPDLVRLHPCLVLAGTPLAELWRSGGYRPWELDETVNALGSAVLGLWRSGIAVTRIGLAPDPALEAAMLAGPRHPALGTMVRARALFLDIRERLGSRRAVSLRAPQRLSGEFWGVRRGLAPEYQTLGLNAASVRFEDREDFQMDIGSYDA
jgi:histone acetyltransferase (RNA polymerase elongator complex component)